MATGKDQRRVDEKELLARIKAVDPVDEAELEGWTGGARGRAVLETVKARAQEDEEVESGVAAKRSRGGSRRTRLALAAAAFVAVAGLGVGVGIALNDRAAPDAGTTTGAVVASVSQEQALAEIVGLARELGVAGRIPPLHPGTGSEINPSATAGRTAFEAAVALGIVTKEDIVEVGSADGVTRAEFALWLWRGFGGKLSQVGVAGGDGFFPMDYSDLAELSASQRDAVAALSSIDVISGYPDGTFRPDDLLSAADLFVILGRLQEAIEARL